MKRQSIGILLCALLMSTFGHELLQRQQLARSLRIARSPKEVRPHARSHLLARLKPDTPSSGNCPIVCKPECGTGDSRNLSIAINVTAGLIGFANKTAHIAVVIDIKANLVGIFNRNSQTAIILNFQDKTGQSFKFNDHSDFESFFASLTSLTVYWKEGGKTFTSINVSAEILTQIKLAVVVLSGGELNISGQEAYALLLQISVRISGSFKVLVKVLESSIFSYAITIRAFVEVFEGLVEGLNNTPGGFELIIKEKIKFSLLVLINQGSSIKIAIYILIQLSGKCGQLDGVFSSTSTALQFLANFGGNSTVGVSGVFQVLADIAVFLDGKASIQTVISVLIEFIVNNQNNKNLSQQFKIAINETIILLQKSQGSAELKVVLDFFIKLRDGGLEVNGVKLSLIIDILLNVSGSVALVVIIRILALLGARIAIEVAIANLFVYLILLLVRGSISVVVLIIGVEISIGLNLVARLATAFVLKGGNLLAAVQSISELNKILIQINISLKSAGLTITVETIFKLNGNIIIGLLKEYVGFNYSRPLGPGPVIVTGRFGVTESIGVTKGIESTGSATGGTGGTGTGSESISGGDYGSSSSGGGSGWSGTIEIDHGGKGGGGGANNGNIGIDGNSGSNVSIGVGGNGGLGGNNSGNIGIGAGSNASGGKKSTDSATGSGTAEYSYQAQSGGEVDIGGGGQGGDGGNNNGSISVGSGSGGETSIDVGGNGGFGGHNSGNITVDRKSHKGKNDKDKDTYKDDKDRKRKHHHGHHDGK